MRSDGPAILPGIEPVMRETFAAMRQVLDLELADLGVTVPQAMVMEILLREGRISVTEVAIALHTTQPNATGILNRMEKAGLVYRTKGEDARVRFVRLTERGAQLAEEVSARMQRTLAFIHAEVTPEEIEIVARVTARVRDAAVRLSRERAGPQG